MRRNERSLPLSTLLNSRGVVRVPEAGRRAAARPNAEDYRVATTKNYVPATPLDWKRRSAISCVGGKWGNGAGLLKRGHAWNLRRTGPWSSFEKRYTVSVSMRSVGSPESPKEKGGDPEARRGEICHEGSHFVTKDTPTPIWRTLPLPKVSQEHH